MTRVLAYLPVETVVKSRQSDYYRVLGEADQAGDCSSFILFMLDVIAEALQQAIMGETPVETRVKTPEQILKILLEQPVPGKFIICQELIMEIVYSFGLMITQDAHLEGYVLADLH